MFCPVDLKRLNNLRVVDANRTLQDQQKLRREPRPAAAQNLVVGVLNSYAGKTQKEVEGIEQFLNIEERDVPGMLLLRKRALYRLGCVAVSASSVVKNDGQLSQESPGHELIKACSASHTLILIMFRWLHCCLCGRSCFVGKVREHGIGQLFFPAATVLLSRFMM